VQCTFHVIGDDIPPWTERHFEPPLVGETFLHGGRAYLVQGVTVETIDGVDAAVITIASPAAQDPG
jgi:hypothetical protein